jgi:Flp pilus assembly protein protease CpaA
LAAIAVSSSLGVPSNGGGILPSLASAVIGLALLIPFYAAGWLGGGCVKMQMAFGAWIGCAFAMIPAVRITAVATLAGGIFTLGALIVARKLRLNTEGGPASQLFPAQVTLSIGSSAGALVLILLGWV